MVHAPFNDEEAHVTLQSCSRTSFHPLLVALRLLLFLNVCRLIFAHKLLTVLFLLSTVGWIVAFIGQIAAEAGSGGHQGVLWFAIFLQLFLIMGNYVCVMTDSLPNARLQLTTFTAVALVFSVIGINQGIYSSNSSEEAVAAGWFLITLTNIIWLFFLTTEEDSPFYGLVNIANDGVTPPAVGGSSGGSGGGARATRAEMEEVVEVNRCEWQVEVREALVDTVVVTAALTLAASAEALPTADTNLLTATALPQPISPLRTAPDSAATIRTQSFLRFHPLPSHSRGRPPPHFGYTRRNHRSQRSIPRPSICRCSPWQPGSRLRLQSPRSLRLPSECRRPN